MEDTAGEAMTDQLMTLAEAGRRLAGRDPNGCLHCFCCTKQLCEHAMLNDGSCADFVNEGMETHVENCPCTTPTGHEGATVA